jgi:hypothetical protein
MKKAGKKKGKKGKKGKKKDAGQRKKKSIMPEMTWKEALLAYDISLKEKNMEDVQYELKQVEDLNLRLKARNNHLKREQENAISILLRANKEFHRKINEKDIITKEHVVEQMKVNWETKKSNKNALIELQEQLIKKDEEILVQKNQIAYWEEYRDRGQFEHEKTIRLLQQEITDMEESFREITAHLQAKLTRAKDEIEKSTAEILDRQKFIATEKAVAKMDKYSRREVIDNSWLTRETETHRKETAELFKTVEKLEEENLKILSELFECQVEDLHISRNFFMTQFADNESLCQNAVLEIDLNDLVHSPSHGALVPAAERRAQQEQIKEVCRSTRPKSAVQQAVEQKLFLLEQLHNSKHVAVSMDSFLTDQVPKEDVEREQEQELLVEDEDEEEEEFAAFDGVNSREGSSDGDPFLEFHHFDDDDFNDYLKLGPLELKLLSVSGQTMPIYKPPTPPEDIIRAKEIRPDHWPVTHKMLRNALHQSPREDTTTTVTVDSKLQLVA